MTVVREKDGIRYHLYDASDIDELTAVQAEAFTSGTEPVMGALRVTIEQFTKFIRLLGPAIERDGLTIVARDVSSGLMVGSSINLDMATENPPEIQELAWLAPALALLGELDRVYLHEHCQGRHPSAGEILHFCWGAVSSRYQGSGICQTMVDVSLELGVAKNYQTAIVEASCLASQHVFRKNGFTGRVEIPYQSYVYQGRYPFAAVADIPSIILLDKQLPV